MREGEEWAEMGGVGNWVRLTASHNHHHFNNKCPQPPAEALKRLTRLDETKRVTNNKGGKTTRQ